MILRLEQSFLFTASISKHKYIQFLLMQRQPNRSLSVTPLPLISVFSGCRLRFVSLLSEPLWLPVISHLFSNLSVQEQPWSGSMWQRTEGAAGPLSQHRTRPGYTLTQQANNTHENTGSAHCGSDLHSCRPKPE